MNLHVSEAATKSCFSKYSLILKNRCSAKPCETIELYAYSSAKDKLLFKYFIRKLFGRTPLTLDSYFCYFYRTSCNINRDRNHVERATKLCFLHCFHVVIVLFCTGLYKSAFSTYYCGKTSFSSFCALVFRVSDLWVLIFSFALCFEFNVFSKT